MAKRTGGKYFTILMAALKVISQHGYARTKVSEIARQAGVADGTVYIYFNSKEDILVSLFQELMTLFVKTLRSELNSCTNAKEKLAALIKYHLTTLENRPEQAIVTQLELRQLDKNIQQGISQPLKSYYDLIEEVIVEGQKTGYFNAAINVRTARKVIFGAVDEVVTCWVMSRKRYALSDYAGPIFDLLIKGLQK